MVLTTKKLNKGPLTMKGRKEPLKKNLTMMANL